MVSPALRAQIAPPATLPTQLWVDWKGDRGTPTPDRFNPPADDRAMRPIGGLWTSTWRPDTKDSAYVEAMRTLTPQHWVRRPAWLLTPSRCHVWEVVDALAQLDLTILAQPGIRPLWGSVARSIDAVHMTEAGARAYLSLPADDGRTLLFRARAQAAYGITERGSGMPLDWWYAESTWWPRWQFDNVESIGDLAVPPI